MNTTTSWVALARAGEWGEAMAALGLRVALALLLFVAGRYIIAWAVKALERGMSRGHVETTAGQFLRKVASVIMTVVLVLAALQVVGVPMTSMIAVLGAAGLAIGLALKDSLSNIASGVMLVTLKPFRVGDVVDIAGESGTVESISIFHTRIRGADNQVITLPNNLITSESITNLTPDVMRRIELVVRIGYGDDIDRAREIVLGLMRDDERVLRDPEPSVMVYGLGETGVELGVRCHVGNSDHFNTKCDLVERIKKAFDAAGICIPHLHRDVQAYRRAAGDEDAEAAGE